MAFQRLFIPAFSVAACLFLAACNTTGSTEGEASIEAGAVGTATYADTLYTVGTPFGIPSMNFASIDTLSGTNSSNWRLDTIGYTVTGGLFTWRRGDSTITSFATSIQIGVGDKVPVSRTYDVYGHDADSRTPRSGLPGKVRIYVYGIGPGGMAWSHPDSTVGEKVQVVVTADSVQVIGKDIKLNRGAGISFNFKAARAF